MWAAEGGVGTKKTGGVGTLSIHFKGDLMQQMMIFMLFCDHGNLLWD